MKYGTHEHLLQLKEEKKFLTEVHDFHHKLNKHWFGRSDILQQLEVIEMKIELIENNLG